MMSIFKAIWSRLAGGGEGAESGAAAAPRLEAVDYNGYRIRPAPYPSRGQYQTAGVIEKDFPDGVRAHEFIRAATHAGIEDAAAFAIAKGKQIVDQQGDRMFDRR